VNISGKEQETTKFGLLFLELATTTPMIAAVMYKNKSSNKFLTKIAKMYPDRFAQMFPSRSVEL